MKSLPPLCLLLYLWAEATFSLCELSWEKSSYFSHASSHSENVASTRKVFSSRLNYKQKTRRFSFKQRVGKACWEVSLTERAIFGCKNNILNTMIRFILRIRKRHPKNTWQEFYLDTDSETLE